MKPTGQGLGEGDIVAELQNHPLPVHAAVSSRIEEELELGKAKEQQPKAMQPKP